MNFSEVFQECLSNSELVAEFNRLRGTNLSLRGTCLDIDIDKASGRWEHDIAQFTAFVQECVWGRVSRE